ncbi:MAG: hypothetical protein CMH30_02415 [Micavibrio sp.]|nr:hypothetical protein [Micavibrio sp.]
MQTESSLSKDSAVAFIAGGGHFPHIIAQRCNDPLIIGIKGQAEAGLYEGMRYQELSLGQLGKLIKLLKQHHIQYLCLIGSIRRPDFSELKFDLEGAALAAKAGLKTIMSNAGDDGVLRLIRQIIEDQGVRLIGAHLIAPDVLLKAGALTSKKPSAQNLKDIERGFAVAETLGAVDVGQAVVVENGVVLGVEAVEGTDGLLERCAPLMRKKKAAVLIKRLKPGQDPDLDMPALGLKTMENLQKFGYAGVSGLAGHTIIAYEQAMVDYAKQHGLFIYGYK